MVIHELEKLTEQEQEEFLRLRSTPPHELTQEDEERISYFDSKIDFNRYEFEKKREEASKPYEQTLQIIGREPYILVGLYGKLKLPDELVPRELKSNPSKRYHPDIITAVVSADLDSRRYTSFEFKGYLERTTPEEKAKIPTLDDLPQGDWPRIN